MEANRSSQQRSKRVSPEDEVLEDHSHENREASQDREHRQAENAIITRVGFFYGIKIIVDVLT